MTECLNCKTEIKKTKKFCNCSCAATYNNARRVLSKETKAKISLTLKNTIKNNPELLLNREGKAGMRGKKGWRIFSKDKICSFCKKEFNAIRRKNGSFSTYCSDECFLKIKTLNAKGIKRKFYNGFKFDSNYEVKIAEFLDRMDIKWQQVTTPINYIDNKGKIRKYFPDFYLPAYNLYLDPKNKFCIQQQKEKLDKVSELITLVYGEPLYIMDYINTRIV